MATRLKDIDTRCITDDSLPWLPLTPYAELVFIKLLAADPERDEMIYVLRAPPGVDLPRHRTSCATTIYTLQGRWKFREYDWVAGPGSLAIEPASSCHTLQVLADGTDDAILFVLAAGEQQLLDAEGRIIGAENWRTAMTRYLDYCHAEQIAPRDLGQPLAAAGNRPAKSPVSSS
jgi:hypothetical protein